MLIKSLAVGAFVIRRSGPPRDMLSSKSVAAQVTEHRHVFSRVLARVDLLLVFLRSLKASYALLRSSALGLVRGDDSRC